MNNEIYIRQEPNLSSLGDLELPRTHSLNLKIASFIKPPIGMIWQAKLFDINKCVLAQLNTS